MEGGRRAAAQHAAPGNPSDGPTPATIPLWDDNPSTVDLLGFDAVVAPVLAAVDIPDLAPFTIGAHGPWGGGKSTILGLLEAELQGGTHVVVRTNPRQYDYQADVKGTLIARVLVGSSKSRIGWDLRLCLGIRRRSNDRVRAPE